MMKLAVCVIVTFTIWFAREPVASAESIQPGAKIASFKLHDFGGAEFDLATDKHRLIVVAFLGTECPLAKLYGRRLADLAVQFDSKGVGFVAIDANQQDTLAEMAVYARASKMDFPFLKDPANHVADSFSATRTPEVFVLNQDRVVMYHGRIDDQFGIGYSRNEPSRRDLSIALDELLAGKEVSEPTTPITGCHIGRVNRKPARGEITFTKDIAPLIQDHCAACHRAGEIGPFALANYDDSVNWSASIREAIVEQRMPPWHADADSGKFLNDRRLSESERSRILQWIDNGMPRGKSSELPQPRSFVEGWQIPKPDLVLEMPESYSVPARGTVEYQYFRVNQTFDEDKWIVASEARPGNRAVVHHLILFFVPPGFQRPVQEASLKNSIATFAPGMPAWQASPGMARRIPAGSKLYFQAHYTPNGAEATDLSRAGLVYADRKQVEKELLTDAVVNFRLRIPPNSDNVSFKAEERFGRDMRVISMLPHMHLRGKAFRIEAAEPDGDRNLVLNVPRYDFNWQNNYVFAEPLRMREGSALFCTATYDNSAKNPANPDPSKTVGWGDQTWEEMMVVQFEAVLEDQDLRRGLPEVKPLSDDEFEVKFSYRPGGKADAVYLAGTFNEWKPMDIKMDGPDKDGQFSTKVKLKPGSHEYKFVIDGTVWKSDPGNPDFTGQYANSVLKIGKKSEPSASR